jgi:hypothetical protein
MGMMNEASLIVSADRAFNAAMKFLTGVDESLQFNASDIQYRLDELGLRLTDGEIGEVCDEIAFGGSEYHDRSMLASPTIADLTLSIDTALKHKGLLDGPGDCPECGRNGHISSAKHASCYAAIVAKANGLCGCGAAATNTRYWIPVCAVCAEREDILDL